MALGGTYQVLPCEARYDLTGTLDTSSAVAVGGMNSVTGTAAGAGAQATGAAR
jgi:hypothetical protein